jgi:hypothetical protein
MANSIYWSSLEEVKDVASNGCGSTIMSIPSTWAVPPKIAYGYGGITFPLEDPV